METCIKITRLHTGRPRGQNTARCTTQDNSRAPPGQITLKKINTLINKN
jgi:hypothetical protein